MGTNYPPGLLQRRSGNAQYDAADWSWMANLPTYDLDLNNASMKMTPNAMPTSLTSQPYLQMDASQTMAPTDIFSAQGYMNAGNAFDNSYDLPSNVPGNSASFGSMTWPAAPTMAQAATTMFSNPSYHPTASDPYIKLEDDASLQPPPLLYDAAAYDSSLESSTMGDSPDETKHVVFSTHIDTLMRTIQAQAKTSDERRTSQSSSPVTASASVPNKQKKRYACSVPDCGKAFYQKTHLEIHTRAHTGVKPFLCREPTCGQRFSQLGNLKTHERRHTGERPYHCDICGKTFAQHGNVRAHKIVHTASKPFTCRLDDCNKQFTQLGNLKSHQNKFHVDTIRRLKERFQKIRVGDSVATWEKEMWEYFCGLYKNCNKGIKGRGKDRRISNTSALREASSASEDSQPMGTLAHEMTRRIC